jgi:hypothetical protein
MIAATDAKMDREVQLQEAGIWRRRFRAPVIADGHSM